MTLEEENALLLQMLAEWVVAVEINGTSWDDWDEYYKDAAYRPGPLRNKLDDAIHEARKLFNPEDY